MDQPQVETIHADFISPSGWKIDPATGLCTYVGMSVFSFSQPAIVSPGNQVPSPISFSFYLPPQALNPDYVDHIIPPPPTVSHVPPPVAPPPASVPASTVASSTASTHAPHVPAQNGLTTARKRIQPLSWTRDARAYRALFAKGNPYGTTRVPIHIEGSSCGKDADEEE